MALAAFVMHFAMETAAGWNPSLLQALVARESEVEADSCWRASRAAPNHSYRRVISSHILFPRYH